MLPALCPEGSTLSDCLTCLSQPQFYTEPFGVWLFIPAILALLPRYSRWPQTDVTLRRCTALCRVKFRKIKSTVHIELYMYSARCSKVWCSSATSIIKKILCIYRSSKSAYYHICEQLTCICTCKIQHVSSHLTVIRMAFTAATVIYRVCVPV